MNPHSRERKHWRETTDAAYEENAAALDRERAERLARNCRDEIEATCIRADARERDYWRRTNGSVSRANTRW